MSIRSLLPRTILTSILSFPAFAADFSNLADNTARDLGVYNCVTSAGDIGCRDITDYSGFSFDANHYQMLMFGGGHSSTMRDDVDEFNLTTLKWKSTTATPNASTQCAEMWVGGAADNFDKKNGRWISTGHATSRHTYDLRAITKDGSELIILRGGDGPGNQCTLPRYNASTDGGPIAHYNISKKTWRFTVNPPWDQYSASEVDPVTGKIIVFDYLRGLWVYDPVTGAMPMRVLSFNDAAMGYAKNLVYFPPSDKFYYFGSSGRVWEVSLARNDTVNNISAASIKEVGNGTGPSLPETGFAYDSANQVIGGGVYKNQFHTFNPISQMWAVKTIQVEGGNTVGTQTFHALDYDPVANVYIFISDNTSGRRTWAYRLSSGVIDTDTLPPSVPTALTAAVISESELYLNWSASTDNVDVVGYKVYRNGAQIKLTTTTSFNDIDRAAATTYTYSVSAYDRAGNTSAQTVGVRAAPGMQVIAPTVSLTTSLPSVVANESVILNWSSENSTSCAASNGWSGDKSVSGSEKINNMNSTSTFALACNGVGGSVVATTTVIVNSIATNHTSAPAPIPIKTLDITISGGGGGGGSMGASEVFLMFLGGLWVARKRGFNVFSQRYGCRCFN